ncbi:class D beta-lactamase [Ningiella sp. W23]|uniref:class D beta-lactamase n=1 Tax=Ningiella sp. W23 TaxID=3023715 RepID=UPI003757292F
MPLHIDMPSFQSIMTKANVKGAILIYDLNKQRYYSNDFEWSRIGQLPASTYKIPNSIIALETGVVNDQSSVFKWDGEPQRFKTWEKDLSFNEAFHYSCVPCYQKVARRIGEKEMNQFVKKLGYGNMDINDSNIDTFWLQGRSKITQFEQIDFLMRFHRMRLPISKRTQSIMKSLMVIESNDEYRISGKTGWSIVQDVNNAWFVGYIESNGNVYFFASNIESKHDTDMSQFSKTRKQITFEALKELKALK